MAMLLGRDERLQVIGVARTAAEALELAAAHELDVILLDLDLPDAYGVDAARQLKAVRPDAKVVLVSGTDPDDLRPAAEAAGAAAYLRKGRLDAQLVETIVELFLHDADDLAGSDRAPHGD
jgi:DNA-binding NarL/FixJ family response regulator